MVFGLIVGMMALRPRVVRSDDRGAVSAEHAILLSLIALVLVAALTAFGIAVSGLIERGTGGF
jgi:Flp pilus assembly pilin Flp